MIESPRAATRGDFQFQRLMIDLRQHWPALALAVLGLVGYLDVKLGLVDLAARTAATDTDDRENVVNEVDPIDVHPNNPSPAAPEARLPVPRGDWSCEGTIATEILRESIGSQAQAVISCYDQLYAGIPDSPAGRLVLELRVGQDGAPLDAYVDGSLQDPQLLDCIQQSAATWQFPPPVGGDCAIISAPFQLGAAD